MSSFLSAANAYYQRGWLTIPLTFDKEGRPKRPIDDGWPSLQKTPEVLQGLSWNHAKGIGVVLGPVSGNLAVIDIDDVDLGEAIYQRALQTKVTSRLVRTIRHRVHLYVTEQTPSPSKAIKCRWRGREIGIELKGQGTQVAAPPTPGYTLLFDTPPATVPSVAVAWVSIMRAFDIELQGGSGGFPPAWQPMVRAGERDKAAYIEAHRLRDAGMPLDQALQVMRLRCEAAYEPGDMRIDEILRTVRSAYRKGEVLMQRGNFY